MVTWVPGAPRGEAPGDGAVLPGRAGAAVCFGKIGTLPACEAPETFELDK